MTTTGRLQPIAAFESRRSPECLLTRIRIGRNRRTLRQSVVKTHRPKSGHLESDDKRVGGHRGGGEPA